MFCLEFSEFESCMHKYCIHKYYLIAKPTLKSIMVAVVQLRTSLTFQRSQVAEVSPDSFSKSHLPLTLQLQLGLSAAFKMRRTLKTNLDKVWLHRNRRKQWKWRNPTTMPLWSTWVNWLKSRFPLQVIPGIAECVEQLYLHFPTATWQKLEKLFHGSGGFDIQHTN